MASRCCSMRSTSSDDWPRALSLRLQPAPRGGRRDRLIAQVMENLDEKRRRCLVGELAQPPLGLRNLQQLGRKRPRGVSVLPRAQRLHGETAEVFDQRQPQHDRNGPELADRERRDVLIRVGEPAQRLLIETAGGVRDEIAREHIDARIAAPSPADERRQLLVIASRKVAADFEQLRPDDVVVVAQPFLGRRLGRLGESLLPRASCKSARGARRCGRGGPATRAAGRRSRSRNAPAASCRAWASS